VTVDLDPGENVTCTFFNEKRGHIVVDKITKPSGDPQIFSFDANGGSYADFSLTDIAAANDQELVPGAYSVAETVPAGWVLTGLTCVSALGTSSIDTSNSPTASITLAAGDTVRCTFEDTKLGQTRTQGFWATHLELTNAVWFGGTAGGHTYPGLGSNYLVCGPRTIDSLAELMGGFWAGISKTSTKAPRSSLNQARMQLIQQLLTAILNNAAFGSSPSTMSLANAKLAFCSTNITTVKNAASAMAAFNTSGDSGAFTPGVAANGKKAKDAANIGLWDVLP
jgi:hypothetical protein